MDIFKGMLPTDMNVEDQERLLEQQRLRQQQAQKQSIQNTFAPRNVEQDGRFLKILRSLMKPGTEY